MRTCSRFAGDFRERRFLGHDPAPYRDAGDHSCCIVFGVFRYKVDSDAWSAGFHKREA